MIPIREVAEKAGIGEKYLEVYGNYMAKINLSIRKDLGERKGKLILVTATSPTPAGEGKTTNTIGLSMALNAMGYNAVAALRQPSLGPVFGIKGGAAGGGKSRLEPFEQVNLFLTGDFPAVAAAHNLLSAMIDNYIHRDHQPEIDVRRTYWPRTVDMNDRALRKVIVGLGGRFDGFPREDSFVITSASEVMAILGLSMNYSDLKKRLGNILIARSEQLKDMFARDVRAQGAMAVILRDALKPNLIQTTEGTPALMHTGPFANIAHGTSSIIATDIALRLFDYVVIEAGFGADLGAEKFFNIVTRAGDFVVDACVIITTIRALKHHGSGNLKKGFPNLEKHVENMRGFGVPVVVAINRFPDDTDEEIEFLRSQCAKNDVRVEVSEVYTKGSEGGKNLAKAVIDTLENHPPKPIEYTYDLDDSLETKILKVAKKIYGADEVDYTTGAKGRLHSFEKRGYGKLPICIAKTQFSLSDHRNLKGRPANFDVEVVGADVSAGAGFVVVYMGDINLMPGLPEVPAAESMDVDDEGNISGVF
ncbi:MAG: formate--tetrahydrofolate ligase [Candidatus Thorarchaeota archaeon]|nr:MAG: formate--tetrahydrofolate ligase [Candidatus Thorarchaeota archaeon]RLI58528.1 MAG: formate--tetrahydrofolate ligase [Candidatus Thorarchaeota archaeon]